MVRVSVSKSAATDSAGNVYVVGRRSERSLYDPAFATFERDEVYDQADATGFIRLHALRLRIRALRKPQQRA